MDYHGFFKRRWYIYKVYWINNFILKEFADNMAKIDNSNILKKYYISNY